MKVHPMLEYPLLDTKQQPYCSQQFLCKKLTH